MAELAALGSAAGLISLGIQSCQGLISYYSSWALFDQQISQISGNIEQLRISCENLERELQRIARFQEPIVQHVVSLISSCDDGIHGLHSALDRCHPGQVPPSLHEKIRLYRARALHPVRKPTLKTLEDNVHGIQGNLGNALQILQLYVNKY